MILSPEIYNKIKSVVFTRLEPPTTTVFWAKPSIPEGNSFDFFVYDRGEWQPLSSYENVVIPNVDAHLNAFINDAGFYIVPLEGIPLSDLSSTVQQALENAYQKPSTGIPKEDLDAAVQSSLNKADTALQSFTETDPTVPEWAKQPNKPSYTAAEVGALSPNSTLNGVKIQNNTVSSRALTEEARYKDLNQVRAFTEALEYSFITFPEVAREVLHGANGYVLLSDNKIYYWNGTSLQMLAESTIRGTIYANLKTGVCYVATLSGLTPIVGPDGSITLAKLSTEVLKYIDSHGGGASYIPTLQSAPTSSTTTYTKDGQTVDFEIGQFCRVPNINGIYTFYQLYDLVIDGNTTAAVWQEVLVDEDFSLAITVLGANNIPQFDLDEPYSVGAFVMNNGFLYKFTSPHTSGEPWNPQEVQQTNLVKEIDQMSKLDYEQVTINVEDEQGQPIEDVEVAVDVEGEASARNLITDAQGRCTTNVQKGLEYTVEVNTPAGYQHTGQIWHRASLPSRTIPIVLLEDTTSQYEHLKVTLSYSDSSLGVADHILVSYDGVDYSAPVVNNVAEFDIPLGKTYTVSFPDIEGYIPPRSRTRVAVYGRTYELHIWYQAAIAGIRWMMTDGSEKELNEATYEDYASNSIFGLIVNTSELANANCGYVIPWDVMMNGGGSGNWLSAYEEVATMSMFTNHAAALTDLDGEQNCERIREHIANQAEVGVTRTSGIAQTTYNRCGGIGVTVFANNVDYAVDDLVSYNNMIYRFTSAHRGNWNADHVEEYGVGYIMPSGELQRCFQVAYGQIYAYRLVIDQVRNFMSDTFGVTALNVASGYWWSSSQDSAAYGVQLYNGGFSYEYKVRGDTLLPALAY